MAKTPANTSSRAKKQSPTEIIAALAERLGSYREKYGYQKAKAEGLEQQVDLTNRVAALESASKSVPPIQPQHKQEGLMAQNDNNPTAPRNWGDIAQTAGRWFKRGLIVAIVLVVGYGVWGGVTMVRGWISPADQKIAQKEIPSTLTTSDVEKIAKNVVKIEMASFEDRFNVKLDEKFADLKKVISAPAPKPDAAIKYSTPRGYLFSEWNDHDGGARLAIIMEQCKDQNWGSPNEKDVMAKLAKMSKEDASRLLVSCNVADLDKKPAVSANPANARAEAAPSVTVAPAPAADEDDQRLADDDGAKVQQANYYPGRQNFGSVRRGGGTPNCPPSFRYDPRERSCIRHTEVSGPSPYNVPDNVARCVPGSRRVIEVRSPTGGRRKVEQVCNVHR